MDDTYHSPSGAEWALLHQLLEKDFLGRDKLLVQLDGLLVKTIDKEGSFSIMINPLAAPRTWIGIRIVGFGHYPILDFCRRTSGSCFTARCERQTGGN